MKQLLNGEFVEDEIEVPDETAVASTDTAVAAEDETKEEDADPSTTTAVVEVPAVDAEDKAVELPSASLAEAQAPAMKKIRVVNPLATLRKTLDDEAYNDVRDILRASSEKLLQLHQ